MIEKNQQLKEQEKKNYNTQTETHTHTLRIKNDGLKPNFVFFFK